MSTSSVYAFPRPEVLLSTHAKDVTPMLWILRVRDLHLQALVSCGTTSCWSTWLPQGATAGLFTAHFPTQVVRWSSCQLKMIALDLESWVNGRVKQGWLRKTVQSECINCIEFIAYFPAPKTGTLPQAQGVGIKALGRVYMKNYRRTESSSLSHRDCVVRTEFCDSN